MSVEAAGPYIDRNVGSIYGGNKTACSFQGKSYKRYNNNIIDNGQTSLLYVQVFVDNACVPGLLKDA